MCLWKARIKQLLIEGASRGGPHADLAAVLDARQLVLKLLANASYGFCGADTSHLCCKPLAEARRVLPALQPCNPCNPCSPCNPATMCFLLATLWRPPRASQA